ncbi:MAG: hypothetical protein HY890_03395 [Deltaproteobacteria bacterium]|nr:hypothetical protein [Deltaproteobacteria bacterium]
MDRVLKSRWFHAGVSALIAVSVVIVYSGTFGAAFHFDDLPNIVENYAIRDLKNLPAIFFGNRGLVMATFALNYAAGGDNVFGYHVGNVIIHIINGILAYFLVFNTMLKAGGEEARSKKIAAYSALLFALHPVQTQAVTYIVQRMESLASLFYLAALVVFIKAADASSSAKRALLYAGVAVLYFLGFKSKEVAITLPFVIALYDVYFLGGKKGFMGRLPLYGALFLLFIYFLVVTIMPLGGFGDLSAELTGQFAAPHQPTGLAGVATAQGAAPSAGFGVKSITPFEYLYTQFNVIVYYITLLFVPINQNLDYDFPISTGLFTTPEIRPGTVLNIPLPPPVVSLIILLFIIGLGVYLFSRSRGRGPSLPSSGKPWRGLMVSFFIFWFFIILAPTSSFIPVIDVIFEHRLYLASLGFFAIFALCFDWFFGLFASGRQGP